MQIGDAAEDLGLSRDTLRYYEKIGLVPRAAKTRGGRRTYNQADMDRLRFVQRAQGVGFSLVEIGQLLKLRDNPERCSQAVRDLASSRCEGMQKQIAELEQMRQHLADLLSLCDGKAEHCPILDKLEQKA